MWITERGPDIDFARLVNPNDTALVVIDVQNDFCHPDGAFGRVGHDNSGMPEMAASLRKLLAAARERKVLTIFVRATYDLAVTSAALARHRKGLGLMNSLCLEGSWGADWYGDVIPVESPQEVVLTKHRFDAFQGTPLDLYLRSNGIQTVIVTGVVTSGCVESTVRDAFFLDYQVVVPRDGVHEAIAEQHETGLRVMARGYATITDMDSIIESWRVSNAPIEPSWDAPARQARAAADSDRLALVLLDPDAIERDRVASELGALLEAARHAAVPVVHVRSADVAVGRSPWAEGVIAPAGGPRFMPEKGEMVVDKWRRSAFADTRLKLLLRTNGLRHIMVAGAERTSGALAATVLDALDADFAVTLIADVLESASALEPLADAGARITACRSLLSRWTAARHSAA